MAGIYIPGMEMPVTCCHCPLMVYDPDREWFDILAQMGAHICTLTRELIDNTKREEHCPLVPVPDHGRLGDLDALRKRIEENIDAAKKAGNHEWWYACTVALDFALAAPPVIDAEEG